ncbi:hypothetical protein DFR31_2482 [Alkalispirillum mobile]|uniref:Uncharacterized protein n=1 Tax=Alkalispirillum mobile TaxID=85925 RepID=A0A498BWV6_9GAMM|nr:hypothetical protein [Alkalispirillum mobile]RLK46776.1 hypothetical protein DFR31_2482 [Alkalispirillum mobile]
MDAAGTDLAAHNHCRLLWQPPEGLLARLPRYQALARIHREDRAHREAGQWKTLTTTEINPEVRAGVGGGAAFRIGLDNGRFVLHASLRLVLGIGGGGSVRLTLDTRHLDLWLTMLHQALVDVGYERVDWIDEDAFEQMSMLAYLSAVTLVDASLFLLRTTYSIRQWFERFTRRCDMASRIAYTLVNDPQRAAIAAWVRQLPPEALGPLLNTLTSEPRAFEVEGDQFNAEQSRRFHQQAILNCLQWIVSGVGEGVYGPKRFFLADDPNPAQKLFEKAVIRMGRDGRPTSESRRDAYEKNRRRLDSFMPSPSPTAGGREERRKYDNAVRMLSRHLSPIN